MYIAATYAVYIWPLSAFCFRGTSTAALMHPCIRGIRPPWMAEVQILHDCMDAGGRAMPGAIAEEQISASTSVYIKKPRLDQMPDRGFQVPWKASVFLTPAFRILFRKAYRMLLTPVYSEFISIFMGINALNAHVHWSAGQAKCAHPQ